MMLNETLNKIENLLSSSQLSESQRKELNRLLAILKTELVELSKTQQEQADSIAGFAKIATFEALRKEKNPELTKTSVHGLKASIEDFENSHPQLFTTIQAIINSLRGLGV